MTDKEKSVFNLLEIAYNLQVDNLQVPYNVNVSGEEVNVLYNLIKRLQAENERLQKYNTEVAFKHYNDGVKEFAEKVKEETYHYYDSDIDELATEMIKSEAKENDR